MLMFDIGLRHTPPHTRAVEYGIDETAKTATMVWEYEPTPLVLAAFVGSAQRFANGNTLIGFGATGQIDEVNAQSMLLARARFQIEGAPLFYRAYRLPSLYKYEAP